MYALRLEMSLLIGQVNGHTIASRMILHEINILDHTNISADIFLSSAPSFREYLQVYLTTPLTR